MNSFPLHYRWLRANGINKLTPWHFIDENEGEYANRQFAIECTEPRKVLTFARRQDCDDCAGFELINGSISNRVIYFHPSFSQQKEPGLISGEYKDIWSFISEVIFSDTTEWATEEELNDLLND